MRIAFRTGSDETTAAGDVAHATSGTTGFKSFGDKAVTALGGSYNSTTGILTLSQRGGYAAGDSEATIRGPGTLYTTHLDLNAENDYVKIYRDDSPADWKDVTLTGNYSACIRMAGLEGVYMDKNLAPGSAEGGNTARTSTHTTEETQNHQAPQGSSSNPNNQLCHDVLTGKVLGPDPVSIPDGDTKVKFSAAGSSSYSEQDFADGFTLQYVYDDWYVTDVTTSGSSVTVGDNSCSVSDLGANSGTGSTPDAAPTTAFFVDADLNRRKISGSVYADGGGDKYQVSIGRKIFL